MSVDMIIESLGGFQVCLRLLGWQGGTIHQVRAALLAQLQLPEFTQPIDNRK